MIDPPICSLKEIQDDVDLATEQFRIARIQEPLEEYLRVFEEYQGVIENLLEETVDLTTVRIQATSVLANAKTQEVIRYLMGPPISSDDLKVLAEATSLNAKRLKADPGLVGRIMQVILDGLDRRRFAWVSENREATEAEKQAAVIASASLIATRRVETTRRMREKSSKKHRFVRPSLTLDL